MITIEAKYKTTKAIEIIKKITDKKETVLFVSDFKANKIGELIRQKLVCKFDVKDVTRNTLTLNNGARIIVYSNDEYTKMKVISVKNIIMDNCKAPQGVIERAKTFKDSNIVLVVKKQNMSWLKTLEIKIKRSIGKWWVKNFGALKKWASS